nr:FRG domain-containing protein [Bacteroides sp.]
MSIEKERVSLTPWDFIPPEQHFTNPKSLKDAIFLYQQWRLQEWERSDPRFLPTPGRFEAILNPSGKFTLWPTAMDYVFLFRGQQDFHPTCCPTLFRGNKSADEMFKERLKLAEFELLISQFPSFKFFKSRDFEIDVVGLAQHYLIDTEILDLTSSLDVALFFAMCDFDGKNYHPKIEDREYIAYIYAYPFAHEIDVMKQRLNNRVRPIGLQPFKRPGEQCGYAMRMRKEESFKAFIYSVSFTKNDSELIFNWFQKNRPLFFEDEFSRRIDLLRTSEKFSFAALKIAAKNYSAECYGTKKTANYCRERMNKSELHFTYERLPWMLTDKELDDLKAEFRTVGKQELLGKIVTRKSFSEVTGYLPYRTEDMFVHQLFLRIMMGGCPSLPGYDSGFEISYVGNGDFHTMCYHYGREQTVPNKITRKVDKWDKLDWSAYEHLTVDATTGKVMMGGL